jgi:hypothetical protein
MSKDKIFRNSSKQENQVDVLIDGEYEFFPGFWPLLDEKSEYTDFLAVGNKNGVPWALLKRFKAEYGNMFKFIYSCQNGPFLVNEYKLLAKEFKGIFDTDYKINSLKRLDCNHSMMVRSFPCDDLFWEPIICEKEYDFNMLTVPKIGSRTKRWDRGEEICFELCERGFKGAVYSQTGNCAALVSERLRRYIQEGRIVIKNGDYSSEAFHEEMCKSLCTVFPNNIDAFPKFIIESLLADRFIVISSDLLLGRRILNGIGEPVVTEIQFNNINFEKLALLLLNLKKGMFEAVSPRRLWLNRYNFKCISKKWASEFNRVFGTKFKQLYYMNHSPRLQKCCERWDFVRQNFLMNEGDV